MLITKALQFGKARSVEIDIFLIDKRQSVGLVKIIEHENFESEEKKE